LFPQGAARQSACLQRVTALELSRAEAYLAENNSRPTLAGAADAAALSPFHLLRVFRAVHGKTPLAFAAALRLERARDALLLTAESIETIALRAGYESRTAVDRAYRRQFGVIPGVARGP
jgi:AraC family transcriptional regulator